MIYTPKLLGKNNCMTQNKSPKFATIFLSSFAKTTHINDFPFKKYNRKLFETNWNNAVKRKKFCNTKKNDKKSYNITIYEDQNHSPEIKRIYISPLKNSNSSRNEKTTIKRANFKKYITDNKDTKNLIIAGLNLPKYKKKNIRSANDSIKLSNHKNLINSLTYKKNSKLILRTKKTKTILNMKCDFYPPSKIHDKSHETLSLFSNYNKNSKSDKKPLAIHKINTHTHKCKKHDTYKGPNFIKLSNSKENDIKYNKNNYFVIKLDGNKIQKTDKQTLKSGNKINSRKNDLLKQSANLNSTCFVSDKKGLSNQNPEDYTKNIPSKKFLEVFQDNLFLDTNIETGKNEFESSKFINFELGESSKTNTRLYLKESNKYINNLKTKPVENYNKEYEKTAEEMELIANEIYNHSNVVSNKNVNILSRKKNLSIGIEELREGEGIHQVK